MKALVPFLLGASLSFAEDTAIDGTVRDRKTGEPIPEYALRLRRDVNGLEKGELVWTDERGRFTSRRRYELGERVQITKLDHPGLERLSRQPYSTLTVIEQTNTFFRVDSGQLPLELTTTVGPSYRLQLTSPSDPTRTELWASLQVEGEHLGPLLRAPARHGDGPWVRFLPTRNDLPVDVPWLLRLESEDGLLAGKAVVDSSPAAEPVAMRLLPTARLDVVVKMKGARSSPFYFGPIVAVEPVRPGEAGVLENLVQNDAVQVEDDLLEYRYRRGALAAGKVRVFVLDGGAYEPRATVTLVAGEAQTCEIVIEAVELPSENR